MNTRVKTLIYIFLCSTILILYASNAGLLGSYKVSKKSKKIDQRRLIGTGSRSTCQQSVKPNSVKLIVPHQKVAHFTIKKRPSFHVYSSASQQINVRFTFIDAKNYQTLVDKEVVLDQGITKINLPESVSLDNQQVYLWNVAIPCQNNINKYQTILRAGVEKINFPRQLRDIAEEGLSNAKKAEIYASNGIWYETLEQVLESAQTETDDKISKDTLTNLNLCISKTCED